MRAHILTIGDEILIGQVVNTNAAYIGSELSRIQIKVSGASTVGDEESEILREFERAWRENDLTIVTGGLGPTHDDITRSCIVKFFETELITDHEVLADIKMFFERRNREMAAINETQALVPRIAQIIRNTKGTAPGTWIEKEGKIFISVPGVPAEMKEMMVSYILPALEKLTSQLTTFRKVKTLLTTGIAESTLFEKLGDINELLEGAQLAFLPSQFGVKLRITVDANNEEEASNRLSGIEQKIRSLAGRFIYGSENDTLEEVIGRLLKERGFSISVAESCTGGLVSSRITNVAGSSEYFDRGVITYSNRAKMELLDVDPEILQRNGAVSSEVAVLMAEGVRKLSHSDIGLSITGILGPGGGSREKPVGTVYIALCDEGMCKVKKFQFGEDRLLNKDRTSQAALEILRKHILGISDD